MSGCTNHRAYIFDRGGERRLGEIYPLDSIRWSRVRDDTSEAHFFARTPDPRCHTLITNIEAGRHELVVYRNKTRVWEGPITLSTEEGPRLEVSARDVTHHLNRSIMRSAYSNAYPRIGHATERLRKIIVTELARKEALDPPVNILPYLDIRTHAGTAKTSRSTLQYEAYVFEELDEMAANGGIDYTTVGRKIIINDVHDNIGEGPTLSDTDFDGPPKITAYGMELATISAVTDGQGKFATFGGVDPYYGEVELLHTAFHQSDSANAAPLPTTAEMAGQAKRNMAGRYPTPMVLRLPENVGMRAATVEKIFDLLVPGVRFPVMIRGTYRQLVQTQKLDRVTFSEDSRGEKVSVTMSPAPGLTPWEGSGETS